MAERLNAPVLKTGVALVVTAGSNPAPTAFKFFLVNVSPRVCRHLRSSVLWALAAFDPNVNIGRRIDGEHSVFSEAIRAAGRKHRGSVSGTVLVRLGVGPVPAKIGDEGRSGRLTCRAIVLIMSLTKNRSRLRTDVRGNCREATSQPAPVTFAHQKG